MERRNNTQFAIIAGIVAGVLAQPILHGVYTSATWWMHVLLFVVAVIVPPTFLYIASRIKLLGNNFPRFVIVGGLTTCVDLGVLDVLLLLFANEQSYASLFPLLATISFVVATLNAFFWNRIWTFESEKKVTLGHVSRFYGVTIASFLINVGLSSLLVWLDPFPVTSHVLWANMAKLMATAVSLSVNYFGYKRLVFQVKQ